ncbi:MAG: PIN domain-containing protein [Spirochaetia bacterium]|nr:PIN domain-containing protein [Spirochaetia bacterium]
MARPYYLLDTNVLSEETKLFPAQNVVEKIRHYAPYSAISTITWYELLYGMKRLPDGRRKEFHQKYLYEHVQITYPQIPFDDHAAFIASDIGSKLVANGIVIASIDLLVASIAIANNMILITRNPKDYLAIQNVSSLMVESWWE